MLRFSRDFIRRSGASPAHALLAVLLLALTMATTLARADGVVLVLGDSISAGYGVPPAKMWVKLLDDRLASKRSGFRAINASVSGDTSAGGLSRLPALLRQHHPAVVVIELGGNDGLRGLRLKNTRENLLKMVRLAQKDGAKVLLLGIDIPPSQGAKYVKEFSSVYPSVAKATGATLVPAFLAAVGADPDLMQSDGIHPNSTAQPKLVETLWPALEALLKK